MIYSRDEPLRVRYESTVLPLSLDFKQMVGPPNVLHQYREVDDERVIEILRTRLDDLLRVWAALAAAGAGPDEWEAAG